MGKKNPSNIIEQQARIRFAIQAKEKGDTAKDLLARGYTADELASAGFTYADLSAANLSDDVIKSAGVKPNDVRDSASYHIKGGIVEGLRRFIGDNFAKLLSLLLTALLSSILLGLGMNPPVWILTLGIIITVGILYIAIKSAIYITNTVYNILKRYQESNRIKREYAQKIEHLNFGHPLAPKQPSPDSSSILSSLHNYLFTYGHERYYYFPVNVLSKINNIPEHLKVTLIRNIIKAENTVSARDDNNNLVVNFSKLTSDIISAPSGISIAKNIFCALDRQIKDNAYQNISTTIKDNKSEKGIILASLTEKLLKKEGWQDQGGTWRKDGREISIEKLVETCSKRSATRSMLPHADITNMIDQSEDMFSVFYSTYVMGKSVSWKDIKLQPLDIFASFADTINITLDPIPVEDEQYPYKMDHFDEAPKKDLLSTSFLLKLQNHYNDSEFDNIKSAVNKANELFKEEKFDSVQQLVDCLSSNLDNKPKEIESILLQTLLATSLNPNIDTLNDEDEDSKTRNLDDQYRYALSKNSIQVSYHSLINQKLHDLDPDTLDLTLKGIIDTLDINTDLLENKQDLLNITREKDLSLKSVANHISQYLHPGWRYVGPHETEPTWGFEIDDKNEHNLNNTIILKLCEQMLSVKLDEYLDPAEKLKAYAHLMVAHRKISLDRDFIMSSKLNEPEIRNIIKHRQNVVNILQYDSYDAYLKERKDNMISLENELKVQRIEAIKKNTQDQIKKINKKR